MMGLPLPFGHDDYLTRLRQRDVEELVSRLSGSVENAERGTRSQRLSNPEKVRSRLSRNLQAGPGHCQPNQLIGRFHVRNSYEPFGDAFEDGPTKPSRTHQQARGTPNGGHCMTAASAPTFRVVGAGPLFLGRVADVDENRVELLLHIIGVFGENDVDRRAVDVFDFVRAEQTTVRKNNDPPLRRSRRNVRD